jgi:hypothetical protein
VGGLAVAGGSAYATHHWDQVSYLKLQQSIMVANQKALVAEVAKQKMLDDASNAAEVAYLKAHPIIVAQTKTVIHNVDHYIPAAADAAFPLPLGFCLLIDAAATGSGAPATSDPAAIPNGAACPVKSSVAASTIAENYGQYRELSAQLTALQDWVKQQATILEQPANGH